MKSLILFIIFWVAVVNPTSAQIKGDSIVSEDESAFYYKGYSDEKRNLGQAMNEAYLEAIKEVVRHSFGFKQSYIENYLSTTEKAEIYGQMNLTTENIRLQGITPVTEKIEKNSDGSYKVTRTLRYLKSERNLEIQRQKNQSNKDDIFQKVTAGEGPLGIIAIKTRPNNAQVTLTKDDGRFQVTGSSNVEFTIPIGRYKINLYKDHHKPLTQELIVGPGKTPMEFQLTRGTSNVEIQTTPNDAKIYINGLPVKDHNLSLSVGEDYDLRIEHPDYYPESKRFSVWFNENKTIVSSLEPKKGRITIFAQPEGADIYLNDQHLGEGKIISKSLSPGNYNVTVKRDGFESHRESVTIYPNRDSEPLNVTLEKEDESAKKNDGPSFWDNLKFDTHSRFNYHHELTYMPYGNDGDGSFFYQIPFGYNYNFNEYLSVGLEYKSYEDSNNQGQKTTLNYLSLRSKFYPLWTDHFRLGVGLDHNQRSEKIKSTNNSKSLNLNSLGGSVSLGIFLPKSESGQFGINIEYRKIDLNKKTNSINMGVTYDF